MISKNQTELFGGPPLKIVKLRAYWSPDTEDIDDRNGFLIAANSVEQAREIAKYNRILEPFEVDREWLRCQPWSDPEEPEITTASQAFSSTKEPGLIGYMRGTKI